MSTRGRLIIGAVAVLVGLVTACIGSSSENATGPARATTPSTGPSPTAPQPTTCPRHWAFDPVEGSENAMVPGVPSVAVSCSRSSHQRNVIKGSELSRLVFSLNNRPLLNSNKCWKPNIGGMVLIPTQMYFNYPSGDVQIVDIDPNCRTVSNGVLTAQFSNDTY